MPRMHAKWRAPPLILHVHPSSLCPQCTAYAGGCCFHDRMASYSQVASTCDLRGCLHTPPVSMLPCTQSRREGVHPPSLGTPSLVSLRHKQGHCSCLALPPPPVCMLPKPRRQREGGTSREGGGACGPPSHPRLCAAICLCSECMADGTHVDKVHRGHKEEGAHLRGTQKAGTHFLHASQVRSLCVQTRAGRVPLPAPPIRAQSGAKMGGGERKRGEAGLNLPVRVLRACTKT
jgi:hypothetical protein